VRRLAARGLEPLTDLTDLDDANAVFLRPASALGVLTELVSLRARDEAGM
jgi:hypothetical protein